MRTAVSGRLGKGKGLCRETVWKNEREERLKISSCKGDSSTTGGFEKELYETKAKLLAKVVCSSSFMLKPYQYFFYRLEVTVLAK